MSITREDLARDLREYAARPAWRDRPWYVSALLGGAGWFAGIFLLVFVALIVKPDSGPALFVTAALLLGAAWGLFMVDRDGAFVSQLAMALSIAGQCALVIGASELFFKSARDPTGPALVAFVLQLVLIPAIPNRLHRAMSAFFACIAWAIAVRYMMFEHAGLAVAEPSLAKPLLGWMFTWLPLGAALFYVAHTEPEWIASGRAALFRPAAAGLIVGLSVGTLCSDPSDVLDLFGRSPRSLGWFALWPLLSAFAALAALCAAFALGRRALAGLCIAAALAHVSHFYYAMGVGLLWKSAIMIAFGVAAIALARHLSREEHA